MTEPFQLLMGDSPVIKQLIKALGIELEGITELVLLIRPRALVTARVRFYPADSDFEKLVEYLVAERRTEELTDEQLIAAAEQAGLCYPRCWDLRGKDAPRLRHLRDFASAIVAELRGA